VWFWNKLASELVCGNKLRLALRRLP